METLPRTVSDAVWRTLHGSPIYGTTVTGTHNVRPEFAGGRTHHNIRGKARAPCPRREAPRTSPTTSRQARPEESRPSIPTAWVHRTLAKPSLTNPTPRGQGPQISTRQRAGRTARPAAAPSPRDIHLPPHCIATPPTIRTGYVQTYTLDRTRRSGKHPSRPNYPA